MTKSFKDYFSNQASSYNRYRPTYPADLYAYLASVAPARDHAWDCGAGNGQASVALTKWFDRVTATDPSQRQLDLAPKHAAINYRCAPAEQVPLGNNEVSLVTVAQALHWFDWAAFYTEVRRVVVKGGLLAVWGYGLFRSQPAIDEEIAHFYSDVVGPYWPQERRLVEDAYTQIPFPFKRLKTPHFTMTKFWYLDDVMGYLSSWSALNRYRQDKGTDPLPALQARLEGAWPSEDKPVAIIWDLFCHVGVVP